MEASEASPTKSDFEPYEPEEELDYEPKPETPEPRYVKPIKQEPARVIKQNNPAPPARYVKPTIPEPPR